MTTRAAILTTLDRTASKINRIARDLKTVRPHESIAAKARLVRNEAEELARLAPSKGRQCSHCAGYFDDTTIAGAVHLASCRIHNGYKNYETWAVALWLDNDEGTYNTVREWATEARDESGDDRNGMSQITASERAVHILSRRLRDEIEKGDADSMGPPDLGASVWSDLLGAALSEVDWHEIAENILSE